MTPDRSELPDTIDVERAIDSLCDHFESCWRRGETPDLAA
jgi:hypothetical protein